MALVLTWLLGTSASANAEESATKQNFGAQWQAKLCTTTPAAAPTTTPTTRQKHPYIEFSFHGPITELIGPLCYHFAGYNETCLPTQRRWLTPATTIELIAPGQVPVELLQGYILLVRFPWQSDELYRYPFADQTCHANFEDNLQNNF
jgi:hypothetical protein